MPRIIVFVAGALAVLAFSSTAYASDVYLLDEGNGRPLSGGVLNARPGETNDVTVVYDGALGAYVITDTAGIRIFDQPPIRDQLCTRRSATTVVCRWTKFVAWLGDGNDKLDASRAAGPDTVQVERYRGGEPYLVTAQRGIAAVGGLGADVLVGSAGADFLDGAESSDEGNAPETSSNVVTGGGGPDVLLGLRGDDRLDGGDGDDLLSGGPGADTIDAGAGDDDVDDVDVADADAPTQSEGDDRITAGAGDDEIFALRGRDVVDAGDGNDLVLSNDGRTVGASTIACGGGRDDVEAARGDTLSGCERFYVLARCGLCTVTLEGVGGGAKPSVLARARIGRRAQSYVLVSLTANGRALVQRRGTVRVRFVVRSDAGRTAAQPWFALKR